MGRTDKLTESNRDVLLVLFSATWGKQTYTVTTSFVTPRLVLCQSVNDGYRCFSLMDASSAVKRQLMVTEARLRRVVQAVTCCEAISREGKRCAKHWRSKAESSISAILSQLPCFGV